MSKQDSHQPVDCWFLANVLFLNAPQKVKDQVSEKEKIERKKHVHVLIFQLQTWKSTIRSGNSSWGTSVVICENKVHKWVKISQRSLETSEQSSAKCTPTKQMLELHICLLQSGCQFSSLAIILYSICNTNWLHCYIVSLHVTFRASEHLPGPKSEISRRNILNPKLDRSEFNPTNHLMASSSPLSHSVCSEGGL